jgi:hypothetical protein
MLRAFATTVPLLLVLALPCAAGTMEDRERKTADMVSLDSQDAGLPASERARRLLSRYRARFPSLRADLLDAWPESELRSLLRVVAMIGFYNPAAPVGDDMRMIVDNMEKRGIARPEDRARYLQFLVAARRFDLARRYDPAYPLPALDDGLASRLGMRGVLVPSEDGASLSPEAFPAEDVEVIVVSSPLCAFSRGAAASIAKDPELRNALARYGRWIMPVEGDLHTESVRRWNAEHGDMRMAYAYTEDRWPFVESWETPTFYFLRGGKVVAMHSGWRSGEDAAILRRHLEDLGVLGSSPAPQGAAEPR